MPQQADYFALSRGARMHLKRTADNRFYFRTSQQLKWVIWGVIALVPLSASLLMAVVLRGVEQVIYTGSSAFLLSFSVLALGVRRHLIMNPEQGKLRLEKSWWGLGRAVIGHCRLADQRAVVAPVAELSEGCLLEFADQKYTVGSAEETRQLALFINRYFAVPAFDRVSQWPQEIALQSDTEAASTADTRLESGGRPRVSTVEVRSEYPSIWDQHILLKLLLPLPLFIVLGVLLTLLGTEGGV